MTVKFALSICKEEQWKYIQILRENNHQPRILYLEKNAF